MNESEYDMGESLIVIDDSVSPIVYKVNLSLGNENFIFDDPLAMKDITRENFTEELRNQYNIKD